MASIIKVDTIKDTGSNDIITSDGAGNITLNASLSGFTSTGIDDNATSTAVTIDSSGNVGIGTSSPAEALEVQTSEATTGAFYSTAIRVTNSLDYGWGVGIDFAQPPTSGGSVAVTGAISNDYDSSNNYSTRFYTMGSGTLAERMRIDSSGNVLVGTTSTTIDTVTFGTLIDADGGLATAFNGGSSSSIVRIYGNAGLARVRGDGDLENTNNRYTGISDRRLKENETPANSQWNDIKALQIKNYNLIEYPNRRHIGVIAQDLEEAGMSSLVKTGDEGFKSVAYSIIYMKAVKCLQEAQTKIETLESTVADLTARLDALENA